MIGRKLLLFLATALCIHCSAEASIRERNTSPVRTDDTSLRFAVESGYIHVSDADFTSNGMSNQDLGYAEGFIDLSYRLPLSQQTGLVFTAGLETVNLDWEYNSYFNEDQFTNLHLAISGYSYCSEKWYLRARAAAFMDVDEFDFDDYTFYQGLLWARYSHSEQLGFHIGFLTQLGLEDEKVYPIIGLDYYFCKHWHLNAVFPMNIGLVYAINKKWSAEVAARYLKARQRVGKDESLSKGIFEYTNYGCELAIIFHPNPAVKAKLLVGSMVGDELEISNHKGLMPVTYEFDDSLYIGGLISAIF